MSEELITKDSVSKEMLKALFDEAFMETSWDSEGDLVVKDRCNCFVLPAKDKSWIRLMIQFAFKPKAKDMEKLVCVNKINADYIILRASVVGNTSNILRFNYDIPLDGGVTRKALVLTLKRFCSIPHSAVADYGAGLIE